MDFLDTVILIVEQLAILVCNPTIVIILLIFGALALDAFALKAVNKRYRYIKNKKLSKRLKILLTLPFVILAIFFPFLLINAISFLILSNLVIPLSITLIFVTLVASSPIIFFYLIIRNRRKIANWIWRKIGPYGEHLVAFIEKSPGLVPNRIVKYWKKSKANVMIWLYNNRNPSLLANQDLRDLLSKFGIYSETILEQYAHNPYISEEQQNEAIKSLRRLKKYKNLENLGLDKTTTESIRSSAANSLEQLGKFSSAIKVWNSFGCHSNSPFCQIDACRHLVKLRAYPSAMRILNKVLPFIDDLEAWNQIQIKYFEAKLLKSSAAALEIERIALSLTDPVASIKSADYLIEFRFAINAQNLLIKIVADQSLDKRYRLAAIKRMKFHKLDIGLKQLLDHPDLSADLYYEVSRSLELLKYPSLAKWGFSKIAEREIADIESRVMAADALLKYDKSTKTRDLLCNLAKKAENDCRQRLIIGQILNKGGWKDKAIEVLFELYNDPCTDRPFRQLAKEELMFIQ